jgi:hypothetical protein
MLSFPTKSSYFLVSCLVDHVILETHQARMARGIHGLPKVLPGLPIPTLLRPKVGPPLKWPQGRRPVAVFYLLGYHTPYRPAIQVTHVTHVTWQPRDPRRSTERNDENTNPDDVWQERGTTSGAMQITSVEARVGNGMGYPRG